MMHQLLRETRGIDRATSVGLRIVLRCPIRTAHSHVVGKKTFNFTAHLCLNPQGPAHFSVPRVRLIMDCNVHECSEDMQM
jgi:hypothetical protein